MGASVTGKASVTVAITVIDLYYKKQAFIFRLSPIPLKIRTRARNALHIDVAGSRWANGACAPTSVETRRPDLRPRPDPARHRKSAENRPPPPKANISEPT
eukprot:285786-Chlamydomonas_euryale.AAC.5